MKTIGELKDYKIGATTEETRLNKFTLGGYDMVLCFEKVRGTNIIKGFELSSSKLKIEECKEFLGLYSEVYGFEFKKLHTFDYCDLEYEYINKEYTIKAAISTWGKGINIRIRKNGFEADKLKDLRNERLKDF